MTSISQKLFLGFGSLLAVFAAFGILTMAQITRLGQAIDIILKENYRSVVACQDMKESLERVDSGILYTLLGNQRAGEQLLSQNISKFRNALEIEKNNITLPGEMARARQIDSIFAQYLKAIPSVTLSGSTIGERQAAYFATVQPLFLEIKRLAQEILEMNQANMGQANNAARNLAEKAYRQMQIAILIATVLALVFIYLARKWILTPIKKLIRSADEIRRGNLDLTLKAETRDEIGLLSESFSEMAAALRKTREKDQCNLARTRRATEEVFKALPTAIAILDLDGRVELSTETADQHFGLKPGILAGDLGFDWLPPLIHKAIEENRVVEREPKAGYVQLFINDHECFFLPMAVPIPPGPKQPAPTGVALILKDVTQVNEQQELKRGVVSTVLHQLRTPLTSLRMSIHLLLEERIGSLNEKQNEMLITARDDSERLASILDELRNLNRIERGMPYVVPKPVSPLALARDAFKPFLVEAKDRGISMVNQVADDLPDVMADATKIHYVFANLLSNALRFTSPGGTVSIRAKAESSNVRFLIEDTGTGISAEHLEHVFEPFYRAPGQAEKTGAGLGLSIVNEIVEIHGGSVKAESVVGKGSTFSFTLPVSMGTHEHTKSR